MTRTTPASVKLRALLRHPFKKHKRLNYRRKEILLRPNHVGSPPGRTSLSVKLTALLRHPLKGRKRRAFRKKHIKEDVHSGIVSVRQKPADFDEIAGSLRIVPKFSIIVPVYNTPVKFLNLAIDSVVSQWYEHWELILVDDCSTDSAVRDALSALEDPRVKTIFLSENQGISEATNVGIVASTGDFIVFLDHDDEITDDCLYELAIRISEDDADYIYSDEDKIDQNGRFVEPFFKPDWSPDTIMSLMYTCHVSCAKRSLVLAAGLLRKEYDGAQDWDLVLRLTERAKKISHVPKVLYHWRKIEGSTAAHSLAKPYVQTASLGVLNDALRRRGLKGKVVTAHNSRGWAHVTYDVLGDPKISIVIPSKDNSFVLERCLNSIYKLSSYRNFEVIVVDNGSILEQTISYLKDIVAKHQVIVVRDEAAFNFSRMCNAGVRASSGSILLFLNDDTQVISPDWLEKMAGFAQRQHVGAVGAKLLYPGRRTVQHVGVGSFPGGPSHAFHDFPEDKIGSFGRSFLNYNWLAVTGACLMVERSKFLQLRGFDEQFPVAYNDVEFCYRLAEADYFNVVSTTTKLFHYESLSRGIDTQSPEKFARLKADLDRLRRYHPNFAARDPFLNPNLIPNDLYFSAPY